MKKDFYQTQYKDCFHSPPAPKYLSEDSLILQEALSLLIVLSELSLNSELPCHHLVKPHRWEKSIHVYYQVSNPL